MEKWEKRFYLWKSVKLSDGKATNDSTKKITWSHNNPENQSVTCSVCKKYPSECGQDTEFSHQNCMNRHVTGLKNKHQKCVKKYLRQCFSSHQARLEQKQLNINLKWEEAIVRLINTFCSIATSIIAFNKYRVLCAVQMCRCIKTYRNHSRDSRKK